MECPCGATTGLQLHHLTYDRVGGEESLDDLQPLCADCHRLAHVLERRKDIGLELTGLYDLERGSRNLRLRRQRELAHALQPLEPLLAIAADVHDAIGRFEEAAPRFGKHLRSRARQLAREAELLQRDVGVCVDYACRNVGIDPRSEDCAPPSSDRDAA